MHPNLNCMVTGTEAEDCSVYWMKNWVNDSCNIVHVWAITASSS